MGVDASYYDLFFYIDIDECLREPCDVNAGCLNTAGTFYCKCKEGYTGDGYSCEGKYKFDKVNHIMITVFENKNSGGHVQMHIITIYKLLTAALR